MRLSYGLYYQLDHTSYMQRIKIPGGILTVAQMNCLNDIADRYGRGVGAPDDAPGHPDPLGADRRGRHDVRAPARGRHHDPRRMRRQRPQRDRLPAHGPARRVEPFDVGPYAQLINDYFLFNPLNLTLPRKFKISFSNCERDCAQGPINDIGFYAHVRTERRQARRGLRGPRRRRARVAAVPRRRASATSCRSRTC